MLGASRPGRSGRNAGFRRNLSRSASAPCDSWQTTGGATLSLLLNSTSDPDVYTDVGRGRLTFTNLAAVPEPAPSLALFSIGLAALGMALRTRRA